MTAGAARHHLLDTTDVKPCFNLRFPLLSAAAAVVLATAAQAETVVGAPFALSGPIAEQVKVMRQSAELAMQHVNSQGGVLGSNYRLNFVDTACDPDKGVEAVRQLIQSGVVALVGPVCSGVTLRAARSAAIPAGVVTLSVASASSLITGLADQDLVFRTAPSEALKAQALARVAHQAGVRTVAVSHASDAYNTSVAQAFSAAFRQLGGQITVNQVLEPRQADYAAEARAAAAGASDLALFAYSGSGGVQYLKNAFGQNSIRRIFGTDGLMSNDLATALETEQLARLTFVLAAADNESAGYKRWVALADAARIKADAPFAANAYDAAFMMALAIEAAGVADRGKVSAGLRAIAGPQGAAIYPGEFSKAKALLKQGQRINYEGASGPVDFDAAGDVAGRVNLSRFVGGAWQATLLK